MVGGGRDYSFYQRPEPRRAGYPGLHRSSFISNSEDRVEEFDCLAGGISASVTYEADGVIYTRTACCGL